MQNYFCHITLKTKNKPKDKHFKIYIDTNTINPNI